MRVGIVGSGVGARHHAPAILDFQSAEIIGVCDSNEEKAKEFATIYNIKNIYTDLDDMLRHQKPDVVHIVTPPKTHTSLAIRAINMGCHVLVEKPMTISTEESDMIIKAAKEKKVKLCVMHNHLFDPHILKAKKMISQGIIGNILYVDCKFALDKVKMANEGQFDLNHWVYHLPLGIFGEHGLPHMNYLLLSFLDNVSSVQVCKKQTKSNTNLINGTNIQLEGRNTIGHMLMFENMGYGFFTVDIYGTKGALHINLFDLTMSVEKQRKLPREIALMLVTVEQSLQSIFNTGKNVAEIVLGRLKRRPGHRTLIKKFYTSIKENSNVPVTGKEGKEVVRVLNMIEEKLKS